MSQLVFVNGLGTNYKGENMYEFIFSDSTDFWGPNWESKPANGYPKPPTIEYIQKVAVFKSEEIELELIQNSDFFSFMDAVDGVICLAWEKETEYSNFENNTRLVFRYGEDEQSIIDKFYERDIILKFEK